MLIGLTSVGGSPGASTTAAALSTLWPNPVAVVDADPTGGDLLAGAGGVVEADREFGLLELLRVGRGGVIGRVIHSQVLTLPSGMPLVPGLAHAGQASAVGWSELAQGLREAELRDIIVDLGRWSLQTPAAPLLWACDVLLVVVRTTLRGLRRAERTLPLIAEDLDRHNPGAVALGLLVVDDHGPYATADIARRLRVPVLGEVAFDPRAASVFSDGAEPARTHSRSPLLRSLPEVVRTVGQLGAQQRALGSHRTLLREPPARSLGPAPTASTGAAVLSPTRPVPTGLREMSRSPRRLTAVPGQEQL